jgi:hypothetical protein
VAERNARVVILPSIGASGSGFWPLGEKELAGRVVSIVLQFSDSTKGAGNAIGFAAGGISALLSFHAPRQQPNGKLPAWVFPDMLLRDA